MAISARLFLAVILLSGTVLAQWQQIPPEMVEELYKAAEQGDAEAQFELGFLYFTVAGIPDGPAKAVTWFRMAAEDGNQWGVSFF